MKATTSFHDEAGFSMTELMVVLVIIGILALLALPRFMNVTTRAKASEAKMMLKQVHTLQKAYYFEHDAYAETLVQLQFEHAPLVTAQGGGTARYQIAVESATGPTFVATATAVVDFDQDGVMNVWQVDQEGTITERTTD